MLVEVLKNFRDKNSNALFTKGVTIALSEERINEINNAGYGELVKVLEEKTDEETEQMKINEIKLNDLKVDQLKELAEKLGLELQSNERKADIIEKINGIIETADFGEKTLADLITE